jgi:hypothetical protein
VWCPCIHSYLYMYFCSILNKSINERFLSSTIIIM